MVREQNQQITTTIYQAQDFSTYGFRYLFHGGRAETYSSPSVTSGNLVQKFDGLESTGGQEYDTQRGTPLGEDVYSYKKTSRVYTHWNTVDTRYRDNGTGGQWAHPSSEDASDYFWGALGDQIGGFASGLAEIGRWMWLTTSADARLTR